MFIPDPDFYPSRIQKQQQKRGVEKKFFILLFCSHKFDKIEYYFIFEMLKKKIWNNFQRIVKDLPKKFSLSSQLYGFRIRDPVSGKNISRIQGSKRHRIPDPDPQHWLQDLTRDYFL
jgi:hypothetical protein